MVAVQNEATLFTLFAFPSIHDPTSTHSCAYHSWKEIMNDHTVSASFKYLVMLLHALKKKKKSKAFLTQFCPFRGQYDTAAT